MEQQEQYNTIFVRTIFIRNDPNTTCAKALKKLIIKPGLHFIKEKQILTAI